MKCKSLTNVARDLILEKILHHRFDKEFENLNEDWVKLGKDLYDIIVSQKEKDLMKTIPENWLESTDNIKVRIRDRALLWYFSGIHNAGYTVQYLFDAFGYDRVSSSKVRVKGKEHKYLFPLHMTQEFNDVEDEEFLNKLDALLDKMRELYIRYNTAESQVKSILYSSRTTKQLVDAWPEIEKFVIEVMGDGEVFNLPAIFNKEQLNTELDLPPEVETA